MTPSIKDALEFYADPFAWKKKHDPNSDVQVPDFYSETSFGDMAQAALATLSPPAGERREAIARLVGKHFGPHLAISPTARHEAIVSEFIRDLLASGLVQDEAGWRDISTAPKDGTEVLVWRPDEGDSDHAAHAGVDKWHSGSWYRSRRDQQPTHWMPLPAPPIRSARDGGGS